MFFLKLQELIGYAKRPSKADYYKICSILKCNVCMGEPFGEEAVEKYNQEKKTNPLPSLDECTSMYGCPDGSQNGAAETHPLLLNDQFWRERKCCPVCLECTPQIYCNDTYEEALKNGHVK